MKKPSGAAFYAASKYLSSNEVLYNAIKEHAYFDLLRIPGIGRGLFAACDGITKGTVVHREDPIASIGPIFTNDNVHKNIMNKQKVDRRCRTCQIPLAPNGSKPTGFCSARCEELAWNSWFKVESKCKREPLEEYCASKMVKFPLLAWKIACQTIQKQQSSTADDDGINDLSLGALCYVNMMDHGKDKSNAAAPSEWTESYHIAMEECKLKAVPGALGVMTLDFWYSILSRVHVNAFRLDILDPHIRSSASSIDDYSMSLKRAAAAAIGIETGMGLQHSGSAVYLLASMANHSCVPNMDITFPDNNHTIEFVALDDVQKHTQLTISYIDQGMHVAQRQQALLQGYGFRCQCEQCVDDLGNNF